MPKPEGVDAEAYIDDGLGMGPIPLVLTDYTAQVIQSLEDHHFPISEKSQPIAKPNQVYIGKQHSDGQITNTQVNLLVIP